MRSNRSRKERAEKRVSELTPEERRARVFQRAVKLLAAKPRSIAELREKLLTRTLASKSLVEEVIARLREYGYLDDERFAVSYASLKVKQRPTGRRRLRQDLKLKKVDQEIAEATLDLVYADTPEEELIDRAIEKHLRLKGKPATRLEAKSLFNHLLRQGFEFELVSDKVRQIVSAAVDDE